MGCCTCSCHSKQHCTRRWLLHILHCTRTVVSAHTLQHHRLLLRLMLLLLLLSL
jgi:hypothetical protein